MHPTFDHLIVTRYNVPVSWGRRGDIHSDEHWLEERRRLFERYCLPSMTSAVNASEPLTWVLLCAADSPRSLRKFMARVVREHSWVVPLYVLGESRMGDIVAEIRVRNAFKARRFLLTTRLDSDDSVGPSFVADLQRAARSAIQREAVGKPQLPAVINFPLGYQAVAGRLYVSVDLGNPFLSFLETHSVRDPVIGCYPYPHRDLHMAAKTVIQLIASGPSWLQVLHGNNEATVVCGLRVPLQTGVSRFPVLGTESRLRDGVSLAREAMGALYQQFVQSADYGWKRAQFRSHK